MSDAGDRSVDAVSDRRPAGARALHFVLAAQIAVAVLLLIGDGLPMLAGLVPAAPLPSIGEPVSPGDQTRRYAPNRLAPVLPSLPSFGDLPDRLEWSEQDLGGAEVLALTGAIRPGDAGRFLKHLEGLAMPLTVALHSPGGSVADALAIGRGLRRAGANTLVEPDAICLSACPYILAGGIERRVSREAVIGVHQHYFGQNVVLPAFLAVSDVQAGQAEVMDFLDEMGVSPLLMIPAMRTSPEDVYILLESELETFSLATEVFD